MSERDDPRDLFSQRIKQAERILDSYAQSTAAHTRTSYDSYQLIDQLFHLYVKTAIKPSAGVVMDENGKVAQHVLNGVREYTANSQVQAKLQEITWKLMDENPSEDLIPVLESNPAQQLVFRSMFGVGEDKEIYRQIRLGELTCGEIVLDTLSHPDRPLLFYAQKLEPYIAHRLGQENGPVEIPTIIPGVSAVYEYPENFTIPSVGIRVKPVDQA